MSDLLKCLQCVAVILMAEIPIGGKPLPEYSINNTKANEYNIRKNRFPGERSSTPTNKHHKQKQTTETEVSGDYRVKR